MCVEVRIEGVNRHALCERADITSLQPGERFKPLVVRGLLRKSKGRRSTEERLGDRGYKCLEGIDGSRSCVDCEVLNLICENAPLARCLHAVDKLGTARSTG